MSSRLFPGAGFLQFEVRPGDPAVNLKTVRRLIEKMQPAASTIIVLPELWATGFDYPHLDDLAGETPGLLEEIRELAAEDDICLAGSLIEKVEQDEAPAKLYNTLYLTGPGGVMGRYRKQHLFSLWQEDRFLTPGDHPVPMVTPRGPVGGLVCYDLRFPELARMQTFNGARLLVVSAQWPAERLDHWQTLLRARAIENQVFVVAGNSCGGAGENKFAGHSMIVAPDGTVLAEAGDREETGATALSEADLQRLRSRFCNVGERPRPPHDDDKLVSLPQLQERLQTIRDQGSKVAFTNGCFDILHSGHVAYLEQARQTADCLVVALNSDLSVKMIKGDGRPINSETDRARVLAALGCVDFVVIFDEPTPIGLIAALKPDVLVKGADWPEDRIVGAAEVKAAGGRVARIAFEHQVSTSAVISRIRQQGEKA
ncbi:ADP-heptose synthase / D-glycero-beta-D-manno-heptose 7-phosphate kinase [hydrothermal vent metagenome]|uniref:D-glycero-beta-D-manno-heptose 1-phosphate adenylyltransferase n=1 Tax=hydrothermal vent metagenome TaxID=652676 RepID=A0A3B0VJU6_9ZZZZ